jgi:hypothetical protein
VYFKLAATAANSIASDLLASIDTGSAAATIEIYTGTVPTNVETAVGAQVLLGTLTCSDPVGTVTGRVLTFGAITMDSAADASGTAAWARIYDGNGDAVIDVDVTNTAGTGAIKLNTVTIVAGGPILLNSFTITVGA